MLPSLHTTVDRLSVMHDRRKCGQPRVPRRTEGSRGASQSFYFADRFAAPRVSQSERRQTRLRAITTARRSEKPRRSMRNLYLQVTHGSSSAVAEVNEVRRVQRPRSKLRNYPHLGAQN